jgi:aerobic carbon-monoxide dehydrogenase medium subunit
MYEFDFISPTTIQDAAKALADQDGMGQVIAGGQTLLPTLKQRLAQPSVLVDLSGIAGLDSIQQSGNIITIGAMTAHAAVATDNTVRKAIPALAQLAGGIGDPQVRNLGTIGGSLANNDPAADYPSAVLALDATIVTDRRSIAADDYFQGFFTTALEPDEIITAIAFPIPDAAAYGRFEQRASRYPLVGVFLAKAAAGTRVAVTGAGSNGVFRCPELEDALASNWSPDAVRGILVPADALMSDMHGSAAYRAALIPVMAERALRGDA